jgi:hypothetical protein
MKDPSVTLSLTARRTTLAGGSKGDLKRITSMQDLTNSQKDLCGYGGTFGVMIAVTVLIQHLNHMGSHWIAYSMVAIYSFVTTSFVLLALQKPIAPMLLIVGSVMVLLAEVALIINFVFSLVVFILMVYTITITVVIYVQQLPKVLKERALFIKADADSWQEKI